MPVIKSYLHGMTAGIPPMNNSHDRAKRGKVQGWTEGATRRNTAFLRSIRADQLDDGPGYALTLTLRHCPPTPTDWHKLRRSWEKRMSRLGMIRLHWVTEWQRRGVPHLHAAIWFPDFRIAQKAIEAWLDLATPYGAGSKSQTMKLIDGPLGWFQYMSKHASRGVKHYQRNPEGIPEQWQFNTGRVWGKSGEWPTREPARISLQDQRGDGGFFAFRRLVRSWRVADARAKGDAKRHFHARTMLRCYVLENSRVRGLSEWIPEKVQDAMLSNLAARGFSVLG